MIHQGPKILSPAECANIVARTESTPSRPGGIYHQGAYVDQDRAKRVVEVWYLSPTGWAASLYEAVDRAVAGRTDPRRELGKEADLIQVSRYRRGAFFRPHQDRIESEDPPRMLSAIVLLSPPGRWRGGHFYVEQKEVPLEQGALNLLRGKTLHAVTPITEGERWTLVRWYRGADAQVNLV